MGGSGSGKWYRWNRKTTVEECYSLDVNRLARDGALRVGASGLLSWSNRLDGRRLASVSYSVSGGYADERVFCVSYRWDEFLLFPISFDDNRMHRKRRVIGVHSGAFSKVYQIDAFPATTTTLHEQINGEPVVVIGNSAANIAAIYSRELSDGTVLQFTPVQDRLPVAMTDTEGNEWDIFGTAVSGPRAGTRLETTNSYTAYWFAWGTFFLGAEIHFN